MTAHISSSICGCLMPPMMGRNGPKPSRCCSELTLFGNPNAPGSGLVRLIGSILRVVYEALYWSREKTEGGVLRPLLVVMEEAHRYVSPDSGNVAADVVKRIAREGRKYGVGAMLVSQRPSEIDETVLSQCGTLIALRLSNPAGRGRVKGALPDNLSGLIDLLPVLRTGETIISGEATRLPVRCRVSLPPAVLTPKSAQLGGPGVWQKTMIAWWRRGGRNGQPRSYGTLRFLALPSTKMNSRKAYDKRPCFLQQRRPHRL